DCMGVRLRLRRPSLSRPAELGSTVAAVRGLGRGEAVGLPARNLTSRLPARPAGALPRWTDDAARAAVAGIGREVHFATVGGNTVAVAESRIAGGDGALTIDTGWRAVGDGTDHAAAAAVQGIGLQVEAVVDHPVAVVVETVANFGLRRDLAHTGRAPGAIGLARLGAVLADPDARLAR